MNFVFELRSLLFVFNIPSASEFYYLFLWFMGFCVIMLFNFFLCCLSVSPISHVSMFVCLLSLCQLHIKFKC